MNTAENFCYQRAQAFAGLGGLEQYRLTGELFVAALENYVCAAASGDPQASLSAAGLSLSGMAPQLETEKSRRFSRLQQQRLPTVQPRFRLSIAMGTTLYLTDVANIQNKPKGAYSRRLNGFGRCDELLGLLV